MGEPRDEGQPARPVADPPAQPQPAQPPTITATASMPDPNTAQSIAQGSAGTAGPSASGSNVVGIAHAGGVQVAGTVNTSPPASADHDAGTQGLTGVGVSASVDLGRHGADSRFATASAVVPTAPGNPGTYQFSVENDHGPSGSPQTVVAAGVSRTTGPVPSTHPGVTGESITGSGLVQQNIGRPQRGVYPGTVTVEGGATAARGVDAAGHGIAEGHAVVSGTVQGSLPLGSGVTGTLGANATGMVGPDGAAGIAQAFIAISENGAAPRSDSEGGPAQGLHIRANGCPSRMFENQPYSASGTVHVDSSDPESITLRNGPSQSVTFNRGEMMTAAHLDEGQFDALVREGARLNVTIDRHDTMSISPQPERPPARGVEGPGR